MSITPEEKAKIDALRVCIDERCDNQGEPHFAHGLESQTIKTITAEMLEGLMLLTHWALHQVRGDRCDNERR